jgi:hypothetical protein
MGAIETLAAKGGVEIMARTPAMFIAFIPRFAIWEIANPFGKGRLFELLL